MVLEQLSSKTMTLNDYYDGEFPASNEMIWNFVDEQEFDFPIPVENITYQEILNIFKKQYQINTIPELMKKLTKSQKDIVEHYRKSRDLRNAVIVICNNIVVDGNHRALAAIFERTDIRKIQLENIE